MADLTLTTAAQTNITSVGALAGGSIASGFGAIDNGASNITTGGLLKLDVDADANDVTGDSATGRLTLGAGEDLNLYHGGTDSYIVNDTGDLIIKNGASDEDILFQGNDGGGAITALTLDMSAAGAAGFNGVVTANAGVVVDNITIDGTEIDLSSGSLTIDVLVILVLDADGATIFLQAGTEVGRLSNSSSDFILKSSVSDKDLLFKGNDGGSTVTALTLDMSDGGTATFNHDIILGDSSIIKLGAGADLKLSHDGSNSYIEDAGTGNLRILASETVLMNAAGNEDMLKATADGAVELYYNNAKKFETTNIGVTINGTAIALTDTDTSNSGNVTLNFAA